MVNFLKKISLLSLFLSLLLVISCSQQNTNQDKKNSHVFFQDFENDKQDILWKNINRTKNPNSFSGDYVNECNTNDIYSFGFELENDIVKHHNALISINMMLKSENKTSALFVVSVQKDEKNSFWASYHLSNGYITENEWYKNSLEVNLPNDIIKNSKLNCYILNAKNEHLLIDDFELNLTYYNLPTFINNINDFKTPKHLKNISNTDNLNIFYSENKKNFVIADDKSNIITKPISMCYSLIIDNDTTEIQFADWNLKKNDSILLLKNINDIVETNLKIHLENNNPNVNFSLQSTYHQDVKVLKSSLIIPFSYDDFKIYRNNYFVDSSDYQDVYYLDNEGFSLELVEKQLNIYHPDEVSSIQLDTRNAIAHINTDYHLDHRLIHFPLSDTSDYYVDKSATSMKKGSKHNSSFTISLTNKNELPRIMPINHGYESAFIWTEHADWTDIKTHRATYFGSEVVTKIEDAVGGFAYYDIPVTKSVFYHNPDSVTNYEKNTNFPGLHSTIKTNDTYFNFLKQLNDNGFEICLHTPEQYTSNKEYMAEALTFMKENFASPTWIDHGYNNSIKNNRENMICDGLYENSPFYVYDKWKQNGVKYLWNASLEDQRPYEKYLYDNNLLCPYPGFGDAFPLPQITQHPSYPDIYTWFTPYTLEAHENYDWDYYLSQERLDKTVDFRQVYIAHIYAPWVEEHKGFWEIKNGKIVAKDGFNQALERILKMKEQRLLLPTTIDKYMTYQEQLSKLEYRFDKDGNILLKNNNNETIKGLSLISTKDMSLDNEKSFNKRKTKSGDEYIIWFDMEPSEELTIYNLQ